MKTIWIIGIGRFGLLAVERLSKSLKNVSFVLADSNNKNFELIECSNCTLKQIDGIEFLNKNLHQNNFPDWIIPALPVHLAAEWCLCRTEKKHTRIDLPVKIDSMLPNPTRGPGGDIYVTHADFLCPDNCAEPENKCTVTKQPRKTNMFQVLEQINLPNFKSLVVRSHQLAPGVGGYKPQQLFDLLDQVKNTQENILISTACRCHGVITGITDKSNI